MSSKPSQKSQMLGPRVSRNPKLNPKLGMFPLMLTVLNSDYNGGGSTIIPVEERNIQP